MISFEEPMIGKRRRTQASSAAIATTIMMTCLLLACARQCHSFVVAPSVIAIAIATTKPNSLPSSTSTFSTKESDDLDDKWEWDGEVVEGAHDAEFEGYGGADDDIVVPSLGFMSMASSVASPTMAVAASGESPAFANFDRIANMGKLHRMELEKELKKGNDVDEDDLMEMGGDPSFLDDEEDGEGGMGEGMDDSDFFEWDGEVDESAHLD